MTSREKKQFWTILLTCTIVVFGFLAYIFYRVPEAPMVILWLMTPGIALIALVVAFGLDRLLWGK